MKADIKALLAKITNTPIIVEQGISGIWTYKKWSDGTAECWGIYQGTVSSWATWGSLYYGEPYTAFYTNYPTGLFISAPVVTAQPVDSPVDIWLAKAGGNGTKDHFPSYFPMRASSSSGVTISVGVYAIGKWK